MLGNLRKLAGHFLRVKILHVYPGLRQLLVDPLQGRYLVTERFFLVTQTLLQGRPRRGARARQEQVNDEEQVKRTQYGQNKRKALPHLCKIVHLETLPVRRASLGRRGGSVIRYYVELEQLYPGLLVLLRAFR